VSAEDEQALLWAYAASEAQSLAEALGQLADQGLANRRFSIEAQFDADRWSSRWAQLVYGSAGLDVPTGSRDRMLAVRAWIAENQTEFDALVERLRLTP